MVNFKYQIWEAKKKWVNSQTISFSTPSDLDEYQCKPIKNLEQRSADCHLNCHPRPWLRCNIHLLTGPAIIISISSITYF